MWPLFKGISLIYFLFSANIWFSFYLPINYVPLMVGIIMLLCVAIGGLKVQTTSRCYALIAVLFLFSMYGLYILNFNFSLWIFTRYFPAVILFMLPKERQMDLLSFVTKWTCIVLGTSIVFYAIGKVVSLPSFTLTSEALANYSRMNCYFFYVTTDMYSASGFDVIRFQGPFIEPGHQSMVCAFLLFANRFQFKQRPLLWILVVSLLMSFSLAGYVMLMIGLLLIKMKNIFSMIGILSVLISSWAIVAYGWNGGDNPVNKLIFERLEVDDQKGIKGNNRTTKQTDYFFRRCVDDGTIVLGVRSLKKDNVKIRGAGYKIYMIRYGIIGTIFATILYLLLINPRSNRRYSYSFFFLVALVFMQRAYPAWFAWLLPYTCGIGIMRNEKFGALLPPLTLFKRKSKHSQKLIQS